MSHAPNTLNPPEIDDERGQSAAEAIASIFSKMPDDIGDRGLGAMVDLIAEGNPQLAAEVKRELQAHGTLANLPYDIEALDQLEATWSERCGCPDCGAARGGVFTPTAPHRVLWLDCAPCVQGAKLRRYTAWRDRVHAAWEAEALDQIGGTHWPRDVNAIAAVEHLLDPDHPSWGAYLWGRAGTGKTQQAAEWIRELLSRRLAQYGPDAVERFNDEVRPYPSVIFVQESALLDSLRPDGSRTVDVYRMAQALVLDDVGESKASDWAYEQLKAVIDHRYKQRLPTLFTSNCELRELRRGGLYDERLTSRIFEMAGGRECYERGELAIVEMTTNYRMPAGEEVLW